MNKMKKLSVVFLSVSVYGILTLTATVLSAQETALAAKPAPAAAIPAPADSGKISKKETPAPAKTVVKSETPAKTSAAKTASTAEKEKKQPAAARGILPPYYKDVVTPTQKDKIYEIQASYNETIRNLEDQVKAMRAERDLKIDQVLTAKQRAEIKAKQEEAAGKRAEKALERKQASGKTSGLEPLFEESE